MNVVLATSEAIPYAKTGGLADVTGTLLHELRTLGIHASLFLPFYRGIKGKFGPMDTGCSVKVSVGAKSYDAKIY
jgi:starch synthase